MDQNQEMDTDMAALFASWTKSATDFWGNMAKMQPFMFGPFGPSEKAQKGPAYQAHKTCQTSAKVLQSFFSMLNEPENLSNILKGADAFPDFIMQMARQSWDGYMELQKQWAEKATKFGQHTQAYHFEGVDQNVFKTCHELYEKEFQKFLNIPQLGLNRFQQERFNRFVDKFNLFHTSLNEFAYMFYVPIEKSTMVMQEKMEEMAEKGEVHGNFKEYYNTWIKVLEGHYMTLLKSPEYIQVMDETINALIQYKEAKNDLLYDVLQNLPIPTNKDMDELYKDFYLLKKKVRELSKKLEEIV